MTGLTVTRVSDIGCRVADERGQHVGNLKLIGARWKFKAIGYDECGAVVPGGGPLTHRHNTSFTSPDAEAVSASLLGVQDC